MDLCILILTLIKEIIFQVKNVGISELFIEWMNKIIYDTHCPMHIFLTKCFFSGVFFLEKLGQKYVRTSLPFEKSSCLHCSDKSTQ